MTKRDDIMGEMTNKLPNLTAALALIIRDNYIPAQTWKVIDKALTQNLLRGAAAGARPLGTNRYQSVAAKRHPQS